MARCNICNNELTENEIQFQPETMTLEPCTTCMTIIMDAAYSGGFTPGMEDEIPIVDSDFDETSYLIDLHND